MILSVFSCRDGGIRQTAWQMLAQVPLAALLAVLTPADWRALFDVALVPPPQPQTGAPTAAAAAGLRPTLQQLREQQGAAASADAPAGAAQQVQERRLQQSESGVAVQQGQRMLQRFLTEGLPPAAHAGAAEIDGALDDRNPSPGQPRPRPGGAAVMAGSRAAAVARVGGLQRRRARLRAGAGGRCSCGGATGRGRAACLGLRSRSFGMR